jgi:hypothetical protein
MNTIITGFICALTVFGYAQTNSPIIQQTITWSVDSLRDVSHNQVASFSCQFKTLQSEKISWIQQNGNYTLDFTINSISGTWLNINNDGLLEYSVSHQGKVGIIKIESFGGKKLISFSFLENGINTMPYVFEVVSFTIN